VLGELLALVPYRAVEFLWLAIELLSVIGVWWVISRWLVIRLSPLGVGLASVVSLGWFPVVAELAVGQVMLVLLFLVCANLWAIQ